MLNHAEVKTDGAINKTKNTVSINFWNRKRYFSQNATNQPRSTVELDYLFYRELSGLPVVTLTK